jgi:hypothetical protein
MLCVKIIKLFILIVVVPPARAARVPVRIHEIKKSS